MSRHTICTERRECVSPVEKILNTIFSILCCSPSDKVHIDAEGHKGREGMAIVIQENTKYKSEKKWIVFSEMSNQSQENI